MRLIRKLASLKTTITKTCKQLQEECRSEAIDKEHIRNLLDALDKQETRLEDAHLQWETETDADEDDYGETLDRMVIIKARNAGNRCA